MACYHKKNIFKLCNLSGLHSQQKSVILFDIPFLKFLNLGSVADLKSEKCYPKENICKDCIS